MDGVFNHVRAGTNPNQGFGYKWLYLNPEEFSLYRSVCRGTFTVATRAAGQARNPRTGEPVTVAASRQPKFKAGKVL